MEYVLITVLAFIIIATTVYDLALQKDRLLVSKPEKNDSEVEASGKLIMDSSTSQLLSSLLAFRDSDSLKHSECSIFPVGSIELELLYRKSETPRALTMGTHKLIESYFKDPENFKL